MSSCEKNKRVTKSKLPVLKPGELYRLLEAWFIMSVSPFECNQGSHIDIGGNMSVRQL
jgi:hypothetical protein